MDARTTSPTGSDEGEPETPEDKRYLRTLFTVYLVLLVTAFSVAVWAQRIEHDFAAAASALGAVLLLVPTMEVVAKRDDRRDATQHRMAFLKAFGSAAAAAALAWLVLGALAVDVTARTELRDGAGLGPGGTAELVVDAKPGGHDELSVTLEMREEVAGATSCIPGSRLKFEGQDLAQAETVKTDEELTTTLSLDAAGPGVSVDITLLSGKGCNVTLVRKQASYR